MHLPALPADEATRLAVLHALQVLDTPPEERFERHTRLACRLFDVPVALVSLVDADRQWFKSVRGLVATQTSRDISFCGHVVADGELLVVPDARSDARFAGNPLVTEDPSIRFYAGAPLVVDGQVMGTLCVIDSRPRQVDGGERACLRDLADLVCAELQASMRSTSDPLTGLCNRRGLQDVLRYLQAADAAASGSLGALSVVRVDLDRLQDIHDTWGPSAADQAVLALSDRLCDVFDNSDWVARLDGDAFCVLSSGRDPADLDQRMRQLMAAVRSFNTTHDGPRALSVSVGSAHVDAVADGHLEALIERAEARLSAARGAHRVQAAR